MWQRFEGSWPRRHPRRETGEPAVRSVFLGPLDAALQACIVELLGLLGLRGEPVQNLGQAVALAREQCVLPILIASAATVGAAKGSLPVGWQLISVDDAGGGREGVFELPGQSSHFLNYLDQLLYPPDGEGGGGFIWHVSGAHGGAGTSCFALALAHELASSPTRLRPAVRSGTGQMVNIQVPTEGCVLLDFSANAWGLAGLGVQIPEGLTLPDLQDLPANGELLASQLLRQLPRLGDEGPFVLSGPLGKELLAKRALLAACIRVFRHVVVDWGTSQPQKFGFVHAWALVCNVRKRQLIRHYPTVDMPADVLIWRGAHLLSTRFARYPTPLSVHLPLGKPFASSYGSAVPSRRHLRQARRCIRLIEQVNR